MPTAAAPSLSYDITSKPLRSSRAFRHLPPRPLRAVHAHRSPPPPLQRLRLPLAQTPDPTHRRPPPAREILRLPLPNGPALPPRAGSSTPRSRARSSAPQPSKTATRTRVRRARAEGARRGLLQAFRAARVRGRAERVGGAIARQTLLRNSIPGTKAIGVHYDQIFLRHGEPTAITAWVPIGDMRGADVSGEEPRAGEEQFSRKTGCRRRRPNTPS